MEELNWNQSVYATTNYTYNARDQITGIDQAGQMRSFGYDGHGRLQSRTTPEQGTTTYSYNPDDTINVVTDARGASRGSLRLLLLRSRGPAFSIVIRYPSRQFRA